MAASLNNKRNTKIEEILIDHPTRNAKLVVARKLYHHGANTCTITYDESGMKTITIDLAGWDTVTTRGKINAFIQRYSTRVARLQRVRGKTIFTHYCGNGRTMIDMSNRNQAFASVQG